MRVPQNHRDRPRMRAVKMCSSGGSQASGHRMPLRDGRVSWCGGVPRRAQGCLPIYRGRRFPTLGALTRPRRCLPPSEGRSLAPGVDEYAQSRDPHPYGRDLLRAAAGKAVAQLAELGAAQAQAPHAPAVGVSHALGGIGGRGGIGQLAKAKI